MVNLCNITVSKMTLIKNSYIQISLFICTHIYIYVLMCVYSVLCNFVICKICVCLLPESRNETVLSSDGFLLLPFYTHTHLPSHPSPLLHIHFLWKPLQLTLEQHRFQLFRFIYILIFLMVKTTVLHDLLSIESMNGEP